MAELNGYELSRNWFDFCFENTGIVTPTHTALYFFSIEHCNRLGWKEKFGMPTSMSMDAIGVKNWRTYSKAFDDIVEWGFWQLVEKSKNQYSATVIAIVKNTQPNTKALTKAIHKHVQKQSSSIAVIDKPINLEPLNILTSNKEEEMPEKIQAPILETFIPIFIEKGEEEEKKVSPKKEEKSSKFKIPTTEEIRQYCSERNNNINPEGFYNYYESNGWMVGRNKMKDWKASVRTWEQRNESTNNKTNGQTTGIPSKDQDRFNVGKQDYSTTSF